MADATTQTELQIIPFGSQFWTDPVNGNFALLKKLIDEKGDPVNVEFYDTSNGCTMENGATDGSMTVINFKDAQIVFVRGSGAGMPASRTWTDAMSMPPSIFVGKNPQILMNTGQAGNYTEFGVILDTKRGAVPVFPYTDKTGGKIGPESGWASVFLVRQDS